MKEKCREKTPLLALDHNGVRLKRADLMQNFRIIPIAERNFKEERNHIKKNQNENSRRMPEISTSSVLPDFTRRN